MKQVNNFFIKVSALGAAFVFLLVILALPPMASAKEGQRQYDPWEWTRKNLNPTWMEWGKKYWPTEPVRGGYFRRAASAYIGLMNPNHWPVNDWTSIGYFYEGITAYDGNYRQTVVWLMESFEFLNPTTLIMKLKRGVKFHDGTDFNAHSLKYLFDWIGDKRNGCWTRGQQRRIKKLEVLDDYTLRWTIKKPWGSFPQGFFAFQISKKALEGDVLIREAKRAAARAKRLKKKAAASGKEEDKKAAAEAEAKAKLAAQKAKGKKSTDVYPVGTGPFMLEEAKPGNYLKVKRNPNWWFGKTIGRPEMPYFDGIKVIVIPDPAIQLANLRAGKIDMIGVSKSSYNNMKNDPNLRVYTFPDNNTTILFFNMAKGPCKDIRVRKAIAHAVDRRALIAGTQFGLAKEASCLFPEDHWAHNPALKPVKYDPELSKRLLKAAGYEKGLVITGTSYNFSDVVTVTTAIKNMLAKVEIDWKVDSLDPVAVSDRMKNLEFDMSLFGQPYIQDPDANLSNIYHPQGGFNYGRSHNEKVIALIEAGRYEIDQKKRQRIYWDIEKLIYDNYMDVWLWWNVAAVAYRKNVYGWNNDMWIQNRTLYSYSHPLWFKDGKP